MFQGRIWEVEIWENVFGIIGEEEILERVDIGVRLFQFVFLIDVIDFYIWQVMLIIWKFFILIDFQVLFFGDYDL